MTYTRTTATQRKALERLNMRYLHVSVRVGMDGLGNPTRTPKGKGWTARRNKEVAAAIEKVRGGV